MKFSPRSPLCRIRLYRNGMFAVILALAGLILLMHESGAAQGVTPRYGHKAAVDKGPRALGLVQLAPSGKARIIPIEIMMDGKFYDAGSYKASPVPMALDFGTVYEGFRTGVSQGIFTITQPGQLNHDWIAEGKWLPAGAIDPHKTKKYAAPVIAEDEKDDRPVLHRRVEKTDSDSGSSGADKDKESTKETEKTSKPSSAPDSAKTGTAPGTSTSTPTSSSTATTPATADAGKKPPEGAAAKTSADASASTTDEQIADPNRPRLRRGKPDPSEQHEAFTTFAPLTEIAAGSPSGVGNGKTSGGGKDSSAALPQVTMIPAISDEGGPDARSYVYDVKPAEEAIYRNKMLELAAGQIRAQAGTTKPAGARPKTAANKSAGNAANKNAKPEFDDVSVRIFDLSSSNEPVLVLSGKTHAGVTDNSSEPREITLIARTNLEGELRKLFFSETDSRHLDVNPRMELIDAVDADGDGRGELLFRRTFDDGSDYAIYRVSADRLWPLYEGTR